MPKKNKSKTIRFDRYRYPDIWNWLSRQSNLRQSIYLLIKACQTKHHDVDIWKKSIHKIIEMNTTDTVPYMNANQTSRTQMRFGQEQQSEPSPSPQANNHRPKPRPKSSPQEKPKVSTPKTDRSNGGSDDGDHEAVNKHSHLSKKEAISLRKQLGI